MNRLTVFRRIAAESPNQLETKGYAMNLSEITKTIVTALGVVVSVGTMILQVTTGFLSPTVAVWISGVVGVATVILNYLAPNETALAERAVGRSVRVKGQKPTA